MRFYELDGGRITLDGVDIAADAPARPARRTSAWCCRTPGCSAAPSATTSRTATPTRPRSRSSPRRKATYVDRFVHSLPDGYDTVIDDEGGNVSAGEKQLLTIARAFLADPAILILDEATSSVDTRTEVLIQKAMAALRSSRTSFVIAHRLSTIRDADTILVMEHGADRRAGQPRRAAHRGRRLRRALQRPVRRRRRRPRLTSSDPNTRRGQRPSARRAASSICSRNLRQTVGSPMRRLSCPLRSPAEPSMHSRMMSA